MKRLQHPSVSITEDNNYPHANLLYLNLTYAPKDFSQALSITIFLSSLKAGSSILKYIISFPLESVGGPVRVGAHNFPITNHGHL